MKKYSLLILTIFLFVFQLAKATTEIPAAESYNDNPYNPSDYNKNLTEYLLHLGQYLGFDIKSYPGEGPRPPSVNSNLLEKVQEGETFFTQLINSYLGARPIPSGDLFVPTSGTEESSKVGVINNFVNATFKDKYDRPDPKEISVSPFINQLPYQKDPVSQAVLDILTTPDNSYCPDATKCTVTNQVQRKIISNITGISLGENGVVTVPDEEQYLTYDYNKQFMQQLNSNSLLGPLLFSNEQQQTSNPQTSILGSNTGNQNVVGLPAQSDAQQAQNFIRYATNLVVPFNLPNLSVYRDYVLAIRDPTGGEERVKKRYEAAAALSSMLANIRVFAAQTSVGISNLYYILAKRMPQPAKEGSNDKTSEALNEFKMATRRLFNPDKSANTTWLDQLNKASTTTVQKEMASLLAEINYQLYLNRQQEERILLTESLLLILNVRTAQLTAQTSQLAAGAGPSQ